MTWGWLTYLTHLDVIFSLLIEGRGIYRVWRGDFADWVDSSCTNHLFRLDELALERILKTFWEMTSRWLERIFSLLTITMYFTEQAQEHYLFNFWIGDFAGVWGALLQVEHVHLIVPSGHLFVHRIQTLAMELISASRCCCNCCCCCCCCCCGKGGQLQTLDAQTATTLSGNWEMEFHSKLDKNQRNIYGIFGSYCKTAHCALRIFNLLFCGAFQPRLM